MLIELGADVNAGEESEVPICLAVQSGKKEMVELLLNKGATNIQKALELARDKQFDEVIGLLLAHIALEKSNDVVNLSGLELSHIKPTWILPSLGMYYSPPKRRVSGHRRNRSLGQMKELLLMRRRSVDVLSLTSGVSDSLRKNEADTGGRISGMDEPESGVHTGLLRAGTAIDITPPSRKSQVAKRRHFSTTTEILPSKTKIVVTEKSRIPVSQSSPVLSRRRLDLSDRHSGFHSASGKTSPQNGDSEQQPNVSWEVRASPSPPPLPPSSRARKIGTTRHPSLSGFEPTLSPIHGTPSHSLNRCLITGPVEEADSGVENGPVSPVNPGNKQLLPPSPSNDSLSSADNGHAQALNHTPRSRRYRERKGTITGARVLPFSNTNDYLNRHRAVESPNASCPSSPNESSADKSKPRREFSMSPSQVFKRFRKHRDKQRGRKVSNSVFYTPGASSPIAIVYPRMDYEDSCADSNEYSFNQLSAKVATKAVSDLEGSSANDDDAFVSSGSQFNGKLVNVDNSLTKVSQKLQRLRKWSVTRQPQRRQSAGTRESSPFSSSSSVKTTPSVSVSNSRRSSVDGPQLPPLSYRQSREEVDFGTYEAIPEESITSEVSVMSTKLIKMVDLSSNVLITLSDLADAPGHELVSQQMAEVSKLDLKQNQLEYLPHGLMNVSSNW